jgi:hypothetical protein
MRPAPRPLAAHPHIEKRFRADKLATKLPFSYPSPTRMNFSFPDVSASSPQAVSSRS